MIDGSYVLSKRRLRVMALASPWRRVRLLRLHAITGSAMLLLLENRNDQNRNVFAPRSDWRRENDAAETSAKYPSCPAEPFDEFKKCAGDGIV